MLLKELRLIKKKDFERVFKKGKSFSEKFLVVRVAKNELSVSRFAFSVSLKVSKKATLRNKARRQLQEIIRLEYENIQSGYDIVFLAKKEILGKKHDEIKEGVGKILSKAELLK